MNGKDSSSTPPAKWDASQWQEERAIKKKHWKWATHRRRASSSSQVREKMLILLCLGLLPPLVYLWNTICISLRVGIQCRNVSHTLQALASGVCRVCKQIKCDLKQSKAKHYSFKQFPFITHCSHGWRWEKLAPDQKKRKGRSTGHHKSTHFPCRWWKAQS